jgi:hypothetical protein
MLADLGTPACFYVLEAPLLQHKDDSLAGAMPVWQGWWGGLSAAAHRGPGLAIVQGPPFTPLCVLCHSPRCVPAG